MITDVPLRRAPVGEGRTMDHSKQPLGAAQGISLGCLLSAVLWLAAINIVLLGQQLAA